VREALADSASAWRPLPGRTFYAVGGTWRRAPGCTRRARLPAHIMHGYTLDPEDGLGFLKLVEEADTHALKNIEAVSEARRPLLAYGAIVLEEIIRIGRPREIVMSALGVREGLLYGQLDAKSRALDPLLAAGREFNLLRARSPEHGEELRGWTDRCVQSAALPETDTERRLRHAACLLADIGWRAHPDYRGEQSFSLIAQAALVGIEHSGRAYLGLSILFRHEGIAADKANPSVRAIAGPRLFERARMLGALMRVAYPISVAMAGVLPRARCSCATASSCFSCRAKWGRSRASGC
jgi:exopolyphosphatase/guanosine-5'-triphosphate,3'-diphosphate pyrophosphatase